MARILVTAGKGGVGKSTVAAATAAACAARGLRALVMSVDSAHNLSDLFGLPLGPAPTPAGDRLWGLEVDINRELSLNWKSVTDFLREMSAHNPKVDELVAEECAVLPGMEEIFGLFRLQAVAESGDFDVVVLDAPPTGDMLKFLRLPDVVHWLMERYLPFERSFLQKVKPVADAFQWPLPDESVVDEMAQWYTRVTAVSRLLSDHHRVSVRLVMTPDRISLAEARRALTWTCLLGMNVDAVVVNKVLPGEELPEPLAGWSRRQREVLEEAAMSFADLPVLHASLQSDEVIGGEQLRRFGEALYAERDPAALWSSEPPVHWEEQAGGAVLRLRLPFLRKGQFRLFAGEEGLSLQVANQRRVIPLPPAVRRRPMRSARYEDGWLRVEYGPRRA